MTNFPHLPFPLFIGLLSLYAGPARAHDVWLERDPAGFLLQRGHLGGQRLPLEAKKIVAIRCLEPGGKAVNALPATRFENTRATIQANCAVISAWEDSGYYSLTPDGEKNLPKNQVPNAVKAWRSKQFAKWVDARSPLQGKPLGDELEVVPVTDLGKVKSGDKATFRILLRGIPVAGAILSIDHKGIGESDEDGQIRIRIREGQGMTVAVSYRRPLKSIEADTEVFEASMTFEVREVRRIFAIVCVLLLPDMASAHEILHQVEKGKAVAVKTYFADGEALAYAEYQVFSPADLTIPHQKGRTDRGGYLAFVPNRPGQWRVVVADPTGHGLDLMVDTASAVTAKPVADWAFILRPMVGVLVIAGLFAGLVFYLRRKAK